MGYERHHAIIVSTWDNNHLADAHALAVGLGCQVTDIYTSRTNHWVTFVVLPDGSKEGWQASHEGDMRRSLLIDWIDSQAFDDGSSRFMWVEVQYGDDNGDNRVLRSNEDFKRTTRGAEA